MGGLKTRYKCEEIQGRKQMQSKCLKQTRYAEKTKSKASSSPQPMKNLKQNGQIPMSEKINIVAML